LERRKIYSSAVKMAQRLAAVYDQSGAKFNVAPVTLTEEGTVITVEAMERRKAKEKEREAAKLAAETDEPTAPPTSKPKDEPSLPTPVASPPESSQGPHFVNPERLAQMVEAKLPKPSPKGAISKTQQRKLELYAPRAPPQKPRIPEGIDIPSDEEENWLELWDLPDDEIHRRVTREKRRAAQARKDLRTRQQTGKAERRAARDEKRRVYRDIKQSWKSLREQERQRRKRLLAMEDAERKKLADEINIIERKAAMECCAQWGFSLENVEGVNEIKPRALGMKGVEVDFDKIEITGPGAGGVRVKQLERPKPRGNRVDLGAIAMETTLENVFEEQDNAGGMDVDFVQFGAMEGEGHEAAKYNHKLRRKLRRAIENAQIAKENLVRQRAIEHCETKGIEVPPALLTPGKSVREKGRRTMQDGTLETDKQERVRARIELAEFNKYAKVLRKQAKEQAIEAGLRVYAELMGMIPRSQPDEPSVAPEPKQESEEEESSEDEDTEMSDA